MNLLSTTKHTKNVRHKNQPSLNLKSRKKHLRTSYAIPFDFAWNRWKLWKARNNSIPTSTMVDTLFDTNLTVSLLYVWCQRSLLIPCLLTKYIPLCFQFPKRMIPHDHVKHSSQLAEKSSHSNYGCSGKLLSVGSSNKGTGCVKFIKLFPLTQSVKVPTRPPGSNTSV